MTRFAFFNGAIVPIAEARVSVMTNALHYGTGFYGGIRGYWDAEEEQLRVFRIADHYRRFLDSARLMMARLSYTVDDLVAITLDLLRREGFRENCYIRPLAYKSDESILPVQLHDLTDQLTIFSLPMGQITPKKTGLHLCTSTWRRVDDTALPARGKLVGGYLNTALIRSEAHLNGFDDALVLNQDGHVSEASLANFFMVRGGVLHTPPVTSNILEGITRRSLIELARDVLGVQVVERDIDRTEVYAADEIFVCGTGVQVAAVTRVDHRAVGSGEPGPVTERLREVHSRVVRGKEPRYLRWSTPVFPPKEV